MPKDSLKRFVNHSRTHLMALLVVGIALIAIGLLAWVWAPRPKTYQLRVTGGIQGLNRNGVAEYMRRHAPEFGLQIEVTPTEGTSEATRKLQSGEIDLALVNGLLRSPASRDIRQVAAITVEALHMLVKQEFAEEVGTDFSRLAGLSVHVGPEGSEAELVASAVLDFCDLSITADPSRKQLLMDRKGLNELLSILTKLEQATSTESTESTELRESLPDVVIHVSSLPSPLARRLIDHGKYRLVPLPFADAFSRITVDEEDLDRDHIDQVHVVPTTIPAFMYGAAPSVPESDVLTLGCPLILVANNQVPDEAVARLLPHIFEGPVARVYRPPAISQDRSIFPWHAASVAYRDKDKPLVRADFVSFIQQLISVAAPLVGGCLALYGFYRWRQTLRFVEYFEQFQDLDLQAKGLASDDVVTPAEAELARQLEGQLTRLQQRAVTDFCRNYFHGEGVLENFLQLLAETRDFLRASQRNAQPGMERTPVEPPSPADPPS